MSFFTDGVLRIVFSIIVLIVLLIILLRFRSKGETARDSLEIMKERYEKGEISKEDYEDARKRRGLK